MAECYNMACPYCVDYQCRRTCTCDMRLDGEYVKIVRCKDCKHFKVMEGERLCGAWEEIFYNPVEENGYCYKGERKDESTMGQVKQEEPVNEVYTVKIDE